MSVPGPARERARRNVVITGVGVHCALGDEADSCRGVLEGRCAVRRTHFDSMPGIPALPAAQAPDVSPLEFLRDRKMAKYLSPAAKLGVVAAGRALRDAGLLDDEPRRVGLALHVATGLIAFDLSSVSEAITRCAAPGRGLDMNRLGSEGLRSCPPLMPFKMLLNMSLGLVSIAFGIRGPNFVTYPGADQAGVCIEAAVRGIAQGRVDRALVGGTAQGLSLMPLATLMRTGRLAQHPDGARTYHPEHAGLAPSDGAAFLVLESEPSARERGATIAARIGIPVLARATDDDPDHRVHLLAELWGEASQGACPARIVTTGNVGIADDERDRLAAARCWPAGNPALESYDGVAGWFGAGSLPFAVAMGARRLRDRGGSRCVESELVSATDGAATYAVMCLTPPEVEP